MDPKHPLFLIGAVVGIVAGLLTIAVHISHLAPLLARLITFVRKSASWHRGFGSSSFARRAIGTRTAAWSLSFSISMELLPIVGAGLLFNFLGLAVSSSLRSVFYLDMLGTAVVAFLLGPWWGATTGLLANALTNYLLYTGADGSVIVFPWSLVNMTGGCVWGFAFRSQWLRANILHRRRGTWYAVALGIGSAALMALPATFVHSALHNTQELALDPGLAAAIETRVGDFASSLSHVLVDLTGDSLPGGTGAFVANYIQTWVRFMPDKILSVVLALVIINLAFPLYKAELLAPTSPVDSWPSVLIVTILYVLPFVALCHSYRSVSRLVWASPWLVSIPTLIYLLCFSKASLAPGPRAARCATYALAEEGAKHTILAATARTLRRTVLIATLIVVAGLPLLTKDWREFYSYTFKLMALAWSVIFGMHLGRLAVSQCLYVEQNGDTKGL
jgi:hypothetical protein